MMIDNLSSVMQSCWKRSAATGRTIALAVTISRGTGVVSAARTRNQHDRATTVAKAAANRIAWYARRVGVAAGREINKIPARRPSTEESILRRAGISRRRCEGPAPALLR